MENQEKQACTIAMLCHLSALSTFIGIPFGNLIGPLIFWLIKKDQYPFVDEHGKESMNFQLSMTLYAVISAVLIFLVVGIILLIGIGIVTIIFVIIASVKASQGESYRYPLTIRFIK